MADASSEEEVISDAEGLKRDEKGGVRFRAVEQSKSGKSSDDA